jgi:hypothetical protein
MSFPFSLQTLLINKFKKDCWDDRILSSLNWVVAWLNQNYRQVWKHAYISKCVKFVEEFHLNFKTFGAN